MKVGGPAQVKILKDCVPLWAWRYLFSEAFKADKKKESLKVLNQSACDKFLRRAPTHLLVALRSLFQKFLFNFSGSFANSR